MTDKTKKFIEDLREHAWWASCNEWEVPITLGENLCTAADLIESLAAELERVTQERDGLSIMLTAAESAAETYKRERDAAVEDMKKLAEKIGDYTVCTVCSHEKDHCRSCMFEWRGAKGE